MLTLQLADCSWSIVPFQHFSNWNLMKILVICLCCENSQNFVLPINNQNPFSENLKDDILLKGSKPY